MNRHILIFSIAVAAVAFAIWLLVAGCAQTVIYPEAPHKDSQPEEFKKINDQRTINGESPKKIFPPRLMSVKFAWRYDLDAHPEVMGFRLYWGPQGNEYTNSVFVGRQTTGTLNNLWSNQRYQVNITAVDTNGVESEMSDRIARIPTQNLQISVSNPKGQLEHTDSLVNLWMPTTNDFVILNPTDSLFFRGIGSTDNIQISTERW